MIAFLRGRLAEALPTQVVIDVNGVGYEVLIPLSSFDKLPAPGGEVTLLTHLAIRDDAHVLYGFSTETERDLFRQLIRHVSGIGPKIALNVLSGTTPASFASRCAWRDACAFDTMCRACVCSWESSGLHAHDELLRPTPLLLQLSIYCGGGLTRGQLNKK